MLYKHRVAYTTVHYSIHNKHNMQATKTSTYYKQRMVPFSHSWSQLTTNSMKVLTAWLDQMSSHSTVLIAMAAADTSRVQNPTPAGREGGREGGEKHCHYTHVYIIINWETKL